MNSKISRALSDIQSGDILTKIQVGAEAPIELKSWSQLASILDGVDNNIVTFEYYSVKKGGVVSLSECRIIEPWNNETLDNQRIEKIAFKLGVSPIYHVSFFGCIAQAGQLFWDDFTLIFRTLQLLIAPSIRQVGLGDLSGPVGIFDMVRSYINAGFIPLLAFAGLLSVNIGVMNLLPIPALDGGRLVFLLYELITRKKPSKKVENTINNVFFILLMLLFVYITFNDVFRMIG
jgi:regulator of sigma E protease